jgi:hypothetical protein
MLLCNIQNSCTHIPTTNTSPCLLFYQTSNIASHNSETSFCHMHTWNAPGLVEYITALITSSMGKKSNHLNSYDMCTVWDVTPCISVDKDQLHYTVNFYNNLSCLTTLYSFTYPCSSTVTVPTVAYTSLLQTAAKAHCFVLFHTPNATLPQQFPLSTNFCTSEVLNHFSLAYHYTNRV